jgi:hypothetical protein
VFTAGDGHPSFWTPSCLELADAVVAVRDSELERLRQAARIVTGNRWYERLAEAEAWRERAETAENAVERARHVCHKAMAEKDAPGQWLVAQKVLAAIEGSSSLPPETPALPEEET